MCPVNKIWPGHDLLFWKGIENNSLEHCYVRYKQTGIEIESVIVGKSQNTMYRVDYHIDLTHSWEIERVNLVSYTDGVRIKFTFEKETGLKWKSPEITANLLDGCTEIDLPLTPFTNSLPINRLNMAIGESQIIKVIYIDFLNGSLKPVEQKYTRMSAFTYKYENVPNDFEALITVDERGFVMDYPGLFTREHHVKHPA